MSDDGFDEFVDNIKNLIKTTTAQLEKFGMTKKAIQKFFAGEEVIICPYCNTPNMFEVHYDKDNDWSMYECLACSKTHLKDWKKD